MRGKPIRLRPAVAGLQRDKVVDPPSLSWATAGRPADLRSHKPGDMDRATNVTQANKFTMESEKGKIAATFRGLCA